MQRPGPVSGRESPDRLTDVAVEFFRLHESGELGDLDDYCSRYPEAERDTVRRECEQFLRVREFLNHDGELSPGQSVSTYEILELIGKGGMGEIYRARDKKLGRDVAIKVLPPELARDPVRVERFEREARAIAALDHPNIVSIHSVETEGTPFLTMELVEGKTLAEIIPKKGLSLERFFDLAIPIVDAVTVAHQHGIVHRDLKPANIMVTSAGAVKVLDFGLAKLREDAAASGNGGSVSQPLTDAGTIVGTAAYMSPEQAEGSGVDPRSDIFNLGIILYEVVTGQRPFGGETRVAQMASIVNDTPVPVRELKPDLPHHLGRVIRRTLEKDPERRYQTAKDLGNELADLRREVSSAELEPATAPARRVRRVPSLLVGVGAGAVLGIATLWLLGFGHPEPEAEKPRAFTEPLPEERELTGGFPVTDDSWNRGQPVRTSFALSPVEDLMVVAMTDGLSSQLFLRKLGDGAMVPIGGTEGGAKPFFSPDGRKIGFYVAEGVNTGHLTWVHIEGGTRTPIHGPLQGLRGVCWGADDYIYFGEARRGISRIPAGGGLATEITEVDQEWEEQHGHPIYLPESNAILYSAQQRGGGWSIHSKRIDGQEERLVIEDGCDARFLPSGHLLYGRSGTLVGVGFNPRTLLPTTPEKDLGEVMQALSGTHSYARTGALQIAVNRTTLLCVPGSTTPTFVSRYSWFDSETGDVRPIGLPYEGLRYSRARLSPGDELIAVVVSKGFAKGDLLLFDPESGLSHRWTLRGGQSSPAWSPDGTKLAFRSSHLSPTAGDPGRGIFVVKRADIQNVRTADDERVLLKRITRGDAIPVDWSPSGILVLDGGYLKMLDEDGKEKFSFPRAEGEVIDFPTFSMDGNWVAYRSRRNGGAWRIHVRPVGNPDVFTDVGVGPGAFGPQFARDGSDRLFYNIGSEGKEKQGRWAVRYSVRDDVISFPEPAGRLASYESNDPDWASNEELPLSMHHVSQDGRFLIQEKRPIRRAPVTSFEIRLGFDATLRALFQK